MRNKGRPGEQEWVVGQALEWKKVGGGSASQSGQQMYMGSE